MSKITGLAATALFLGALAGGAQAGIATGGGFNSFSFVQTGPITPLGVGEGSSLPITLTADFFFGSLPTGPVAFQLTLTEGVGLTNVPMVVSSDLAMSSLCTSGGGQFTCSYTTTMPIEPGETIPLGSTFTMVGTLHNNGLTIAQADDSFNAAPEPASLGLFALTALGLGLSKRRRRR